MSQARHRHVYEVSIDVLGELSDKYHAWLLEHVQEMKSQLYNIEKEPLITKRGTVPAPESIDKEELKSKPFAGYTIKYVVSSKEDIEDYIQNRSGPMRDDAVKNFGAENFRGSRRVYKCNEDGEEIQ